jgi:hypothetical protein
MKIVIAGINTTNVDNISWCLGAAGLAGMDTIVDITKRIVETDSSTIDAEEFGTMMLALHEYGFAVEIQQDENPPTVRFDPETLLVSAVPALTYIVEFQCSASVDQNAVFAFVTIGEAVDKVNSCLDTDCAEVSALVAIAQYGAAHYSDRFNRNQCVITKAVK